MSLESIKSTVERELNPLDFVGGFYDSAVQQPLNAISQLGGQHIAESAASNDSLAAKAGNLAGFIFDFTLLAKATGSAADGVFGKAAGTVAGNSAKMFVAGGLYGGLLTPSSNEKSLLQGRLENALVSGSTFAIMGGVGKALEGTAALGSNALLSKVAGNAIAGGAGGVVEAYGSVYFADHRWANPGEVLGRAGQYALFGAGFGALDFGLSKGTQKLVQLPAVQDAYYRTRWNMREGQVEAKRMTYSVLNKYGMRHPLQRLGNLFHGTDVEVPAVQLTPENNPIASFEKELPQYFQHIQQKEDLIQGSNDHAQRYDIYEQQKQIRTDFALKLLQLWHGTAEQPGIKMYSDAQLATEGTPAQRVAQIRQALTLSGKSDYPNPSPLSQALADLAGRESAGRYDEFDIVGEISAAKAQFYNYDESELSHRMGMPSLHHWIDHNYSTPLNWLPFEASEQLPNLFHGSVSNSLPSIFTERMMLPASELRLRGIGQITGESAGEHFPRRSISLTKDFNEAWAYHRHSPENLTGFPVVFGVSADVIARAHSAGMLEPGEILIDKLGVGTSLFTRLGLKRPDITHLYVPDSEVGAVSRQLLQWRIKGVNVVGLNQLRTPQWTEPPQPSEIERW